MHVAWFIWSKTRIKHICTVHWNKWGFTLYRENQYNNRLCAQRTPCACLISTSLLHCYTEDTACKVTYYDIKNLFFPPLFKFQSQTSHLGFGLKSWVLSTKTTVQKRLMLKESSWDTHPPPLKEGERQNRDAITSLNSCTPPFAPHPSPSAINLHAPVRDLYKYLAPANRAGKHLRGKTVGGQVSCGRGGGDNQREQLC